MPSFDKPVNPWVDRPTPKPVHPWVGSPWPKPKNRTFTVVDKPPSEEEVPDKLIVELSEQEFTVELMYIGEVMELLHEALGDIISLQVTFNSKDDTFTSRLTASQLKTFLDKHLSKMLSNFFLGFSEI